MTWFRPAVLVALGPNRKSWNRSILTKSLAFRQWSRHGRIFIRRTVCTRTGMREITLFETFKQGILLRQRTLLGTRTQMWIAAGRALFVSSTRHGFFEYCHGGHANIMRDSIRVCSTQLKDQQRKCCRHRAALFLRERKIETQNPLKKSLEPAMPY